MLSFLFRLIREFRREHGFTPNALYINRFHYRKLRECLPDLQHDDELAHFLTVEVIVSEEAIHPHVAWLSPARRNFASS
ncbi:MAG: hypothetical protein ACYDDO_07425 [Acidiferrobacterales bacterium]